MPREFDEPLAAFRRHAHARRVLVVGDRVEELRPQPLGEPPLELVDLEPVLVHRDGDELCVIPAKGHDRAEVRRRFDDDDVACVEERLRHELEPFDRAARDQELVVRWPTSLGGLDATGDRVERTREAARWCVLERARLAVGRELGEQRRRALAREGRGIRKAAGERDQTRDAEQRENRRDALADVAPGSSGEALRVRRDRHGANLAQSTCYSRPIRRVIEERVSKRGRLAVSATGRRRVGADRGRARR